MEARYLLLAVFSLIELYAPTMGVGLVGILRGQFWLFLQCRTLRSSRYGGLAGMPLSVSSVTSCSFPVAVSSSPSVFGILLILIILS